MGKTARIKGDLDDVEALLEIISVLKDVSTNRFFVFAQQKEDLAKFLEVFLVFFEMLGSVETNCLLVRNNNPNTDIVVITSESSFMSQFNSRVCSATAKEVEKYPGANVICVGWRGQDRLKALGLKVTQVYRDIEVPSRYETALKIRDYLISRIVNGTTGRAICIYTWAKNFSVLKPRVVRLLPATELAAEEPEPGPAGPEGASAKPGSRGGRSFILESAVDGIMAVLADVWVSSRVYEVLSDTKLAETAAQAQQLESSIDGLSKEKSGLALSFKKAQRGDLNKAMREVFTSSKAVKKR